MVILMQAATGKGSPVLPSREFLPPLLCHHQRFCVYETQPDKGKKTPINEFSARLTSSASWLWGPRSSSAGISRNVWLEMKGRTYTVPFFCSSCCWNQFKPNSAPSFRVEGCRWGSAVVCCSRMVWSHSLCPVSAWIVPSHPFLVQVHNRMQD